jgi:hypothetical protein
MKKYNKYIFLFSKTLCIRNIKPEYEINTQKFLGINFNTRSNKYCYFDLVFTWFIRERKEYFSEYYCLDEIGSKKFARLLCWGSF